SQPPRRREVGHGQVAAFDVDVPKLREQATHVANRYEVGVRSSSTGAVGVVRGAQAITAVAAHPRQEIKGRAEDATGGPAVVDHHAQAATDAHDAVELVDRPSEIAGV